MAKQQPTQPAQLEITKLMYHCRCYKVGDVYEMWILDPATGTYNGPYSCTEQQCRNCNMSEAEVVGAGA